MFSKLREVIYNIEEFAPLIKYFSLPAEIQIEALPILEKQRLYDFPDGDLLTNNALEVLTAHYETYLNAALIRIVTPDEEIDDNIECLNVIMDELLGVTHRALEQFSEDSWNIKSLDSPEWCTIRRLSQYLLEKLQIQLEVNREVMSSFLDLRIHA